MIRSPSAALLSGLLAASLAFSFTAQSSDTPDHAGSETAEASSPEAEPLAAEDAKATPLRCPDSTASRIKRPRAHCASPGRVYSADDIARTGEIDVGRALQRLDPSITSNRF